MHTHPAWERLSDTERESVFQQHASFQRQLEEQGAFVASYTLADASQARTVRRDARAACTVTRGPLAGGGDSLGGIYVIEAASSDEAVAWARKGRFIEGANEVRPIREASA